MKKPFDWKRAGWIAFFILPGLSIVAVFILLPLFLSLYNSLFSWNQLIRSDYIGLENFKRLFGGYPYQPLFLNALLNNLKWFVVTMLVQNCLGLLFGYLLSRGIAGTGFYTGYSSSQYCFPSLP
jgi:raffinose/stachyose/melibiose transport system permease protein